MIAGRRNEVIEGRQTTFFFNEPLVYGRENVIDMVIVYLTVYGSEFKDDLSVYSIFGPDGFGKTTFAKLIFHHPRVVNNFELRIWVCSFSDFSLKGMMEAIIKAAIGCDCEDLDLDLLQKKLQYLLQRKRYLLVLDFKLYPQYESLYPFRDDWQRLKSVLACGKVGASILVTTCLWELAQFMRTDSFGLCELSKLSNSCCRKLFLQQVFEPNDEIPIELEAIGKVIVESVGECLLRQN